MRGSFFLYIILFLILHGCSDHNKVKDAKNDNGGNETYNVRTIDVAGLEEIIDNREGKILFINVWATWCVPCVEEFPDVVRIANDYEDKNFEIITLNTDQVSDIESKVIPFLKKNKVEFPVYIVEDKNSQEIIELLNKDWSGAIQVTIIYDEAGKQQSFMLGAHDYHYFKKSIDSVLTP